MLEYPKVSPHFLKCRRAVRQLPHEVVLGVSGGPDSLALAAACAAEAKAARVVIIDHGLQSVTAQVAQDTTALCRSWGLEAEVRRVQVPTSTEGMEAAARRVRYEALRRDGLPVAVAHTAEDQAETFLLSALRGHASGMEACGHVLRPFLDLRRADTVGTMRELGITAWADPHNEDLSFRRVAMRKQIIPLLEEIAGGDIVEALAQAAGEASVDNAFLERLAGPPTDDCATLAAQARPLRRRRIVAWLNAQGLSVNKAIVEAIDQLVVNWHGQGGVAVGAVTEGDGAARRLAVKRVAGRLAIIVEDLI